MERMAARQAEAWAVDLTPYTLACWYIFVVAMPLTHVLGLVAHAPRRAMARHVLLYPLLGGRTHSIFSVLAWVLLPVTTSPSSFPSLSSRPSGLIFPAPQAH